MKRKQTSVSHSTIPDIQHEFSLVPVSTSASLGENVILGCSPPEGHPAPTVRWSKGGSYLDLSSDPRFQIVGRSTSHPLFLTSINRDNCWDSLANIFFPDNQPYNINIMYFLHDNKISFHDSSISKSSNKPILLKSDFEK